jgi:hypothetical protein
MRLACRTFRPLHGQRLVKPTAAANRAGFGAVGLPAGFLSITVNKVRAGRFWRCPPSLSVLDRVEAEPTRVREPGFRHTMPIPNRFRVKVLRQTCLESFLAP